MSKPRFVLLLPSVVSVVTAVLWFLGRAQYLRFVCPPDGACPQDVYRWSDFTPIYIQLAGIVSIPVATFANPLYRFVQEGVHKSELFAWLVAVAAMWALIGWLIDRRNAPPVGAVLRRIAGAIGLLLALVILATTIPMFHVGLIYKAAALVYVYSICRYSVPLFRKPQFVA